MITDELLQQLNHSSLTNMHLLNSVPGLKDLHDKIQEIKMEKAEKIKKAIKEINEEYTEKEQEIISEYEIIVKLSI